MFKYHNIESFKSIQTPFYYYDLEMLQLNLDSLKSAVEQNNFHIHYALKANTNEPILKLIRNAGLGADCVSGNEVRRAIETGFSPNKIVFAGVGKTDEEIRYALEQQISCFNVESIHELIVINEICEEMDLLAPVALRINPDIDAKTNQKITTGTRFDKFGIAKDEIAEVLNLLPRLERLRFKGLHFHIGSQITDMAVFKTLSKEINAIQNQFAESGFKVKVLNLGGGLGVDYEQPDEYPIPDYDQYFEAYLENLDIRPGQELHFELGRSIVAACGSLISKVLYLKNSGSMQFAIIDAGMNDLMRPALYKAKHKIQNLTGIGAESEYQVAGPICESSDIFGKNVSLPQLSRGDLVAIRTAGAYGEVMSSTYNLRHPAKAFYSTEFRESVRKIKIDIHRNSSTAKALYQ